MQKLLVANWKENPLTEREATALFKKISAAKRGSAVKLVICPPFVHLESIAKKIKAAHSKKNLALGAQDVFWKDRGAFTGEIGPATLRSLGAKYVIVGHSERRKIFRETDAMINKKVLAALTAGLTVILCVGEPLSVRKKGAAAARRFIKNQLKKDLRNIENCKLKIVNSLLIAYEPIWAIGTGKNADPADAAAMATFIKQTVQALYPIPYTPYPRLLYGGSVNGKNILDYVYSDGIDGALVGGASLKAEEFKKMIESVAGRRK